MAQIFACKLQNLINKEVKNSKDFSSKILNLSKVIGDECLRFQKKYDIETDHGTLLDFQKNYNKDINRLIEENCNK